MLRLVLLIMVSFGVGFVGMAGLRRGGSAPLASSGGTLIETLARSARGEGAVEVLLIYIGSSTCLWANDPSLAPSIRAIVDSVSARAVRAKAHVTLVGVDLDPAVGKAGKEMAHLRGITAFDQYVIGGRYLNVVARDAYWGGLAGPSGTPQVVVVAQSIRRNHDPGEPLSLELGPRVLLARKVGLPEILEWARVGVPTLSVDKANRAGARTLGVVDDP